MVSRPETRDMPALLRGALLSNATFSTLSALTFCSLYASLAAWMGLEPAWTLPVIGIGLLGFAGFVAWAALRPQADVAATWSIILGDLAWVAGSVALLLLQPGFLNANGQLLVGAIALVVGGFALFQYLGLRRAGAS